MGKYAFGVDVGGTTIKMGLFDMHGEVDCKWEVVTRKEDKGSHILPDIAKSIKSKCKELNVEIDDVVGIGIGVPGPVDLDGLVYGAANLGWGTDVIDIPGVMFELTGIRTKAGNDANVAALGEMWKGGGVGHKNVVAVTLGTGVGGGIIIDGEILAGATGAGGEIGHMHVEEDENEKCGCGNIGCLEQYASATGIVRLAKKQLSETDASSVLRDGAVSAKTVFDAVKEGDPLAVTVAEKFGEYLGKALANIAAVVNPEIFVIGGGVSKAGPTLLTYIEKNYQKYAFRGCKDAEFALATLGNDAGINGAVRMIMD